jgi:hypothetical protein
LSSHLLARNLKIKIYKIFFYLLFCVAVELGLTGKEHRLRVYPKVSGLSHNEINNNKHSLRSNTKSYDGKTHYNDSQNSNTTAPYGRELYHLQISLQAASPETFGCTVVYLDLRGRKWLKAGEDCIMRSFIYFCTSAYIIRAIKSRRR